MQKTLIFCTNYRANPHQPSCAARGSESLLATCRAEVAANQLPIQVETFQCFGACQHGPVVRQMPDNTFYYHVSAADIQTLLQTVLKDNDIARLCDL